MVDERNKPLVAPSQTAGLPHRFTIEELRARGLEVDERDNDPGAVTREALERITASAERARQRAIDDAARIATLPTPEEQLERRVAALEARLARLEGRPSRSRGAVSWKNRSDPDPKDAA
jgi:hypothetical protein